MSTQTNRGTTEYKIRFETHISAARTFANDIKRELGVNDFTTKIISNDQEIGPKTNYFVLIQTESDQDIKAIIKKSYNAAWDTSPPTGFAERITTSNNSPPHRG